MGSWLGSWLGPGTPCILIPHSPPEVLLILFLLSSFPIDSDSPLTWNSLSCIAPSNPE